MASSFALFAVVMLCSLNLALVGAAGISPVQKVISMIDEFAAKVQKDVDVSSKQFESDAQFCDDESVAKTHAIKDTSEQIESLSADIESQKAKLIEFGSNIEDASGRISDTEGELYKATTQRTGENKDFLANEKEILKTVETLDGATATLRKTLALTQMTPASKENLDKQLGALSQLVEASFVTHAQRTKVKAFLQARAESEDELVLSNKGEGGSDSIFETLGQLTEKAEGTLSDVRKSEMVTNHDFTMIRQSMESQIASTKEELAENTHGKQISTQALAQATKDLAVAKKALASDSAYLKDLKLDCQDKARTWEAEHKDANAELKALSAAKGILTKKFQAAFIAKGSTLAEVRRNDDDSKTRALEKISQLGKKFHSTALLALAYRAASDPFGKVRTMVQDMITKLEHEAAEEATQKAFCDEETGKSMKSKDEKEGKLEQTNARIEKAESGIATLSGDISALSRELAEIDSAVKVATDLRQAESAQFRVAEKDFSESQEACAQAIEVLREYYEGASSLLQADASRDAGGIIGLLEVAESDFSKLLADARQSEDVAATEYKKMTEENKISKSVKEAESKGKESEVKTLKTALANGNEDKDGITTELDAVLAYLSELKPQCETKAPSYAETKSKREQEIQGLKDALDILEDSVALVQKGRGNLRRAASK